MPLFFDSLQFTGLFAAEGGHAFSRGEGGFFIALGMSNEKDGCGMREITYFVEYVKTC